LTKGSDRLGSGEVVFFSVGIIVGSCCCELQGAICFIDSDRAKDIHDH